MTTSLISPPAIQPTPAQASAPSANAGVRPAASSLLVSELATGVAAALAQGAMLTAAVAAIVAQAAALAGTQAARTAAAARTALVQAGARARTLLLDSAGPTPAAQPGRPAAAGLPRYTPRAALPSVPHEHPAWVRPHLRSRVLLPTGRRSRP